MPFKSQKQRAYLYMKHPEIAKRWEKETPKKKKLPMYVKSKKKPGDMYKSYQAKKKK